MANDEILDGDIPVERAMVRSPRSVVLMPVMDMALATSRLEELQAFCAGYLQESQDGGADGGDFGIIPGAGKKKVLLKSGSEKLCDVYGLADRYRIVSKTEDFGIGLFDYTIECDLIRKTDGMFVGSGLGSCSSWESKYRWREAGRVCPNCGEAAIIKGREEYGGGWLCWAKKNGCGAKYSESDPAITSQVQGRVENPDIVDAKNTVLKIAKKRAKIDAVIGVTRSSGIFTQDLEELVAGAETAKVVAAGGSPVVAVTPPASGASASTDESHVDRIARLKREAAKKAPVAPVAHAQSGAFSPAAPAPQAAAATAVPGGKVGITAINVRNSNVMVMVDGKSKPSWGPLYVVAFSDKVVASDGAAVSDATTFDEKLAMAAQDAKDAKALVTPDVQPGKKKGSYNLVGLG